MEKKRTGQIVTILVLSFAVLFMSVGFAAFSQTLDINGTANVDAAKWSVHFDKATYEETTGSVTATNPTIGDTSITYEITLEKPGDYYSFNINVINDGTFDANLTKITISSLTEAQQKYLKYTVTYDGTPYTTTTSNLNSLLSAKTGQKTVNVKVEYILPEQSTDLPTEEVTVTLNAALDYSQV